MSYDSTILGTAGLVSYWKLDETSGTVAADSFGSNPGTYTGGFTLNQAGNGLGIAQSVLFNGTSGCVSIPNSASLQLSGPLSLEAWVNFAVTPTANSFPVIAGKQHTATAPFNDYVVAGGGPSAVLCGFTSPGGAFNELNSGTTSPSGIWFQLLLTFGVVSNSVLYINGASASTTSGGSGGSTSTVKFGIAAGFQSGSAAGFLNGSISRVSVYNAELSAATALSHYNAGITAPPSPPARNVIVSSWDAGTHAPNWTYWLNPTAPTVRPFPVPRSVPKAIVASWDAGTYIPDWTP